MDKTISLIDQINSNSALGPLIDKMADKQFFKCANKPGSNIEGLTEYKCPLWDKNDNTRGSFDKHEYKVDYKYRSLPENFETIEDFIDDSYVLCESCYIKAKKRRYAHKQTRKQKSKKR